MMNRRTLLSALAAWGLCPRAWGFGKKTQVNVIELDLGPGTESRPRAWKQLLYEAQQTTSVDCGVTVERGGPEEPKIFDYPFATVVVRGAFALPSEAGLEQLSQYLSYGGFLLIDDASGGDPAAQASIQAFVSHLFPTRPISPLPREHSIHRAFFLIDRPLGRTDRASWLEGVTLGNLTPVVVMRDDLSGALDRRPDGRPKSACVPGGDWQRKEATKLAINLLMYSLTANYKRDQAHVRQLMREGRLE
jgi:hypothetical protein